MANDRYYVGANDEHGVDPPTPGKRTPVLPGLGRQIYENEVNRGNCIDIRLVQDLFQARKHGLPIAPDNGKRFNKQRVTGTPSLIAEDIRILKDLQEETAYSRRYKLLASA